MKELASSDVLRTVLDTSDRSQAEITRSLGMTRTYLSSLVYQGDIPRIDTLARIAHECGYRIYLEGHGEVFDITDTTPDTSPY